MNYDLRSPLNSNTDPNTIDSNNQSIIQYSTDLINEIDNSNSISSNSDSTPDISIGSGAIIETAEELIYKKAASLSVLVVTTALFVDGLLYTLPISFLPILLKDAGNNDLHIGILFGCKAFIQILCNPIIGYIINTVGVRIPMLVSTAVVIISTILFGLTSIDNYYMLCFARGLQGIGSSAAFSAGMSHLSQVYKSDIDRGTAMGDALSGVGLALLLGPPLGGIIYNYTNRGVPFYVVSGIATIQLILLYYTFYLDSNLKSHLAHTKSLRANGSYLQQLKPLLDPYILIVLITYALLNSSITTLEFLAPIYLKEQFQVSSVILGLLFLPLTLGYLIGTPLVGRYGGRYGRSSLIMFGTLLIALTQAIFTLPNNLIGILSLMSLNGLGFAAVDGCISTLLANLLDSRHDRKSQGYGIIFSASDLSLSIGYVLGSFCGSAVADKIGFIWANRCFAVILLAIAPFMLLLRQVDSNIKLQYQNKSITTVEADNNNNNHNPLAQPLIQSNSINNNNDSVI